jgi:hypothetical protein
MSAVADKIVQAMERADEMEDIIIIYRMKTADQERTGVGWLSTLPNTHDRVALMEETKHCMYMVAYRPDLNNGT